MCHQVDGTARCIVDYCVANNIRYQKDNNFVKAYFPGECTIVYYPPAKAIFYAGIKVMESPNLTDIKTFLDRFR